MKFDKNIAKKSMRIFLKSINNKKFYVSASITLMFLLTVLFQTNFCFAYGLKIGDTVVGVVPSKEYADTVIEEVNTEYKDLIARESVVEEKPVLVPTIIKKDDYTDTAVVKESVKAVSSEMVQSYVIKVDGKPIVALNTSSEAQGIIDEYINSYLPIDEFEEKADITHEVLEKITLDHEYSPLDILKDRDTALISLNSLKPVYESVNISENETIDDILLTYNMTYEEFDEKNKDINGLLDGVTSVVVKKMVPLIRVMTTEVSERYEEVDFETESIEDDTLYEDDVEVVCEGQNGLQHVTEKIIKINGQFYKNTIMSKETIVEPVTKVQRTGTLERPPGVGTGSFITPYNGKLSSTFGYRSSGKHTGVDICGPVGDDIVAADNGVVISAGWAGGYGYLIKIDHNNGYITYYAHCSKLIANVGDVVAQGEVIAKLGNTGNSTGPHVHFEVRLGSEILNPLNFI